MLNLQLLLNPSINDKGWYWPINDNEPDQYMCRVATFGAACGIASLDAQPTMLQMGYSVRKVEAYNVALWRSMNILSAEG